MSGDRYHRNIKEDQVLEGEITRVVDEAAFVDIGTAFDAIIPRKDLDRLHHEHMERIQEGELIKVRVTHLPVDGATPLVSVADLGHAQDSSQPPDQVSEEDRWAQVAEIYQVGDRVKGVVKNIKKYGAFVELPVGIDGLVHVSEMQDDFTPSPWDVVSQGEQVLVEVIKIEPDRKRIGLSLRRLNEK